MSGENENYDPTEANAVTDSAIRRSLLGRADAVEQAKFEALLMLDDVFERRVHRLELELADDFSFGKLSWEEQQLFTSRFLVTPGRLRELAVSDALRKFLSTKSPSSTRAAGRYWKLSFANLFAVDRPFASVVLATAALLVFGTLVWLSLKAPLRPSAISKKQSAPSPEKHYAHPVVSPDPKDNSANDRGAEQRQVPTITLQPEGKPESKQTVRLPNAGVTSIRLGLLLDVNPAENALYEARLMSADGVQVATFSELKAQTVNTPKVVIDVPAEDLKSGDYLIELRRISEAGPHEPQRYSFIVKQE